GGPGEGVRSQEPAWTRRPARGSGRGHRLAAFGQGLAGHRGRARCHGRAALGRKTGDGRAIFILRNNTPANRSPEKSVLASTHYIGPAVGWRSPQLTPKITPSSRCVMTATIREERQ